MKALQTCTYIFVVAVVLITSILQFHHHDAVGNMCLFETESCSCQHSHNSIDTETSGSLLSKSCPTSQSHNAQSQDNDTNCGLKLSKMNAKKECNILPQFNSFIIIFDIISKYILPDSIQEDIFNIVEIKFQLPKKHVLNFALRAPPIL